LAVKNNELPVCFALVHRERNKDSDPVDRLFESLHRRFVEKHPWIVEIGLELLRPNSFYADRFGDK
jgi:hypothetical protein